MAIAAADAPDRTAQPAHPARLDLAGVRTFC